MKVSRYILHIFLFRKVVAGPYPRYLEDPKIPNVLKDIHEGDCWNHNGSKSLFSKILGTAYYLPAMRNTQ